MTPKIIWFFEDSDLRCGHDGLAPMAKKKGLPVTSLRPGEFLIFTNRYQNKFKLLGSGNVLVYLRSSTTRALTQEDIAILPTLFSGKHFDFSKAAAKGFINAEVKAA